MPFGCETGISHEMNSPESVPEPYLAEHVRDALAQDPRLSELHVDITTTPGKVFLTGTVGSEERRTHLTGVVQKLLPDREVVNHTTVEAPAGGPEMEKLS
jgi:osmotically-inducible protein OsmY